MKFIKKILTSLLISIVIINLSKAGAITSGQCKVATKNATSALQVATRTLTSLYNVFPIRIGNVPVLSFGGLEDYSSVGGLPTCICIRPPGIPVPGIKVSLWEPISLVEAVALPLCSPTFGIGIPLSIGIGTESIGSVDLKSKTQVLNTYQTHYIKYPVFKLLNMFLDFVCLQADGSIDYLYITELDPLWQNDTWSAILNPEVFLVSNPIAQFACIADSITASLGFPLDVLWWCFGSWGSSFPLTENAGGTTNVSASANLVARTLFKLHRQTLLWGSVGEDGLCQKYPMPIMRKSQYGIFPIYPTYYPKRIPIGRTGLLWEYAQDIPFVNLHTWVWAVYRKRDCCAF